MYKLTIQAKLYLPGYLPGLIYIYVHSSPFFLEPGALTSELPSKTFLGSSGQILYCFGSFYGQFGPDSVPVEGTAGSWVGAQ